MNLDMTLQMRFDAFWEMRRFHEQVFGDGQLTKKDPSAKKEITISKPAWMEEMDKRKYIDTDRLKGSLRPLRLSAIF